MKFPLTNQEIQWVAEISRQLALEATASEPNQIVAPLNAWIAGVRSYSYMQRAIIKVDAQKRLVSNDLRVKTPRKIRKKPARRKAKGRKK